MTMLLFQKKHEISIRFLDIYKSMLGTVKDLSSMNVNLYSAKSKLLQKNGVKCVMQTMLPFVASSHYIP